MAAYMGTPNSAEPALTGQVPLMQPLNPINPFHHYTQLQQHAPNIPNMMANAQA